ncbi:MAG TPA: hypothetical protein VFL83_20965 [Anaeromyxobacter sp.]|nr:hypothetical protein [Anaeromyxobacter sp.]
MARTIRPLAAALALALAGVAPAAPDGGLVLVLENAERGRRVAVALPPGGRFSVTSRHSMYDAPVTETFVLREDGRIVLRRVSSSSAAVREYLGLTAAGEDHAVERVLPEIVFRIAMGEPQRLRAGGLDLSFLELGQHGDRLVMRAAPRGDERRGAGRGRGPVAGP